ncbi:precorrin-6A synthase (deacetylating) [Phreatobacter stygius]|uniref:Precorrin-6A synthase [deacetylating] n=1 Tax=Phreatobacter stygius TaxID=1940610 RepID=A0A4D7B3F6_9HYPH|nr:precorrin-6A synthase (deacetylating) [Phreatobacter stygius]QCI68299.1 precorrin-6A synthase (deacetylating) [Phreatobacter stygius]
MKKKILVIGIGAGNPEHVTVQAINALNEAKVFFVLDKGEAAEDLVRLREEICARYIRNSDYRVVKAVNPPRDRADRDYLSAVDRWHHDRATLYQQLIQDELQDGECGAFLVWGDPSLYDSTLRILDQVLANGVVDFDCEVIPGISSPQALAAAHRMPLNRIGEPVRFTTGRRISEEIGDVSGSSVVFLDDGTALTAIADQDLEIYWGAYLGTPEEMLVSGRLPEVAGEIAEKRLKARQERGWIMDLYLLRRSRPQ